MHKSDKLIYFYSTRNKGNHLGVYGANDNLEDALTNGKIKRKSQNVVALPSFTIMKGRPWRKLSLISSSVLICGEGYDIRFKGYEYKQESSLDSTSVSPPTLPSMAPRKRWKLFIHAFHKGITILCQSRPCDWKRRPQRHIGLCCQGAGGRASVGKQATTWTWVFYQDMSFKGNKWRNRVNTQVRVNFGFLLNQWRGKFCQEKCHSI